MEDKVYQAMVVMDASTGNMLNYRQLRRDPKIQYSLEQVGGKRVWQIGKRCGQSSEGNKNNRIHSQMRRATIKDEGCDIWFMYVQCKYTMK